MGLFPLYFLSKLAGAETPKMNSRYPCGVRGIFGANANVFYAR